MLDMPLMHLPIRFTDCSVMFELSPPKSVLCVDALNVDHTPWSTMHVDSSAPS